MDDFHQIGLAGGTPISSSARFTSRLVRERMPLCNLDPSSIRRDAGAAPLGCKGADFDFEFGGPSPKTAPSYSIIYLHNWLTCRYTSGERVAGDRRRLHVPTIKYRSTSKDPRPEGSRLSQDHRSCCRPAAVYRPTFSVFFRTYGTTFQPMSLLFRNFRTPYRKNQGGGTSCLANTPVPKRN